MKWPAKELHIFNILQRYKHQARCFVVHALPEINARRPMVYIDCTFLYEGVMLRLTMQVLFLKKIEKKKQKKNLERGFQLKAMDFQFS